VRSSLPSRRDIDARTLKPPQLALKPHTNTAGDCNRSLYCLDVQTFSSSVILSLDLDDLPSISSLYSSSGLDQLVTCFAPDHPTYVPPFLDHDCFPPAIESPSPSPIERTSLITANVDGEWQEIAYPSFIQLPLVPESTTDSELDELSGLRASRSPSRDISSLGCGLNKLSSTLFLYRAHCCCCAYARGEKPRKTIPLISFKQGLWQLKHCAALPFNRFYLLWVSTGGWYTRSTIRGKISRREC